MLRMGSINHKAAWQNKVKIQGWGTLDLRGGGGNAPPNETLPMVLTVNLHIFGVREFFCINLGCDGNRKSTYNNIIRKHL